MRSRFPARFAFGTACAGLATLGLGLAACGTGQEAGPALLHDEPVPVAAQHQAATDARSAAAPLRSADDLATLSRKANRLNRTVNQFFGPDAFSGSPQRPARLLAEAEAEWNRRYRRCQDDECRRGILSDRLARMEYAFEDRTSRFPGLAFPSGSLGVSWVDGNVGEIVGSITIYPVIDDQVLIGIGSISPPPVGASCWVIAEGRPTANGGLRMESLDDSIDTTSRWHMGMTADGRLKIEDIRRNRNWWCGAANGIPATYTITSSNGVA